MLQKSVLVWELSPEHVRSAMGGVILDSNLSFDSQVTEALQSCFCQRKLSKVKASPLPLLASKSLFMFSALPEWTIAMHFILAAAGFASKLCHRFAGF